MIMKKIILLITVFVGMFAQGMKADEYTTIIEKMLREGVIAGNNSSTQQLGQLQQMAPDLTEYMESGMLTDVAEIMAPYYRANCTVEEMKQMVEYLTAPEKIEIVKKMTSNMQANGEDMEQVLGPVMQSLMMGGEASKIEPLECSKEYEEAFNRLAKINSMEKVAKGSGNSVIDAAKGSMKILKKVFAGMGEDNNMVEQLDAAMAQIEEPMKKVGEFMENNMLTIIRNSFIQNVSLEELNQLCEIEKQSFYPAYKRANEAMLDNMGEITDKTLDLLVPKMTEVFKKMIPGM